MRLALLLALLLLVQDSGGSMGGGDFGGGGGDSSSSSDYGGGSSSSDWGSDSGGGGGGSCSSSDSGSIGWVLWLAIGMILLVLIASRLGNVQTQYTPAPRSFTAFDVSVVALAVDWHARASIQKELGRLARTADTSTKEGLSLLLREAASSLIHSEISWLYADASDYTCNLTPQGAERVFRAAAAKAKMRYKKETLRNIEGAKAEGSADSTAKPHEGAGVVVVTVVVAARKELPDVRDVIDAGRLKRTLRAFTALSSYELAAVEIVWSPAEENDRMSTAELETLYPEMKKINPASIAGRVFCKSCAGPYAAELLACPHCGAVDS